MEYDGIAMERGLVPCEIETGIYFTRAMDGTAVINTNDPLVIARLVNCKFFKIENQRVETQGRKQVLVYVDGTIPIGALNIGKPRSSNSIGRLVKAPKFNAKPKKTSGKRSSDKPKQKKGK